MVLKNRFSLNQMTVANLTLPQAIESCVRHGVASIGLWRHRIEEVGLSAAVKFIKDSGLHVSSVCRGGMFPDPSASGRDARIDDNFRAIDQAAALEADSLVLVVGAGPSIPLPDARQMVVEGLARIAPYAQAAGVRLALEPLHPMYAGDRSVLNTIDQALALAIPFDPMTVGIILDTFHIWWDPALDAAIARCTGRVAGFHVCDWLVPLPDVLMGRGLMGEGVIEIARIRQMVDDAGYEGPIEVEIFNQSLWDTPSDEVMRKVIDSFIAHV
jgi:sugar phosphate isomerase/epimerase